MKHSSVQRAIFRQASSHISHINLKPAKTNPNVRLNSISTLSTMANPSSPVSQLAALTDFQEHLLRSRRIVALLGAGLSASSGLPTFRGAGGLWRTHDATTLATPEAFAADPALVWRFYSYRRHMALNAQPNPGHHALAELAKRNPRFITLSQNIDGLSPRAGHPAPQLKLLHGSLFDVKCTNQTTCGYQETDNFVDPIVPALALPQSGEDPTTNAALAKPNTNPLIKGVDISSADAPLPPISTSSLPQCPQCGSALLRPGVVWFGEALPVDVLADVDAFFSAPEPIDLMLVIGTSATVYPAAAFSKPAKYKGARIAVVNPDPETGKGLDQDDWFFCDDAATILPQMLKPVVGDLTDVIARAPGETSKPPGA